MKPELSKNLVISLAFEITSGLWYRSLQISCYSSSVLTPTNIQEIPDHEINNERDQQKMFTRMAQTAFNRYFFFHYIFPLLLAPPPLPISL